jgi:hypothetical protein
MTVRCASIFSQLLSLFPRVEFASLVRRHGAERAAKGFSCWSQLVAMLFCQLAQAKSLREITGGLRCCLGKLAHLGIQEAPKRSTLSYANAHRPWQLYQDLFYAVLSRCRGHAPAKRFRFKNKLLSLDATVIDLCLSLFPWARFRRTKGAIKLHMLLDHDGYLPTYCLITEGKTHDLHAAWVLDLAPESVVALDRGYNDYALFGAWTERRVWFVTRMKDNAVYTVESVLPVPQNRNILKDEIIMLAGIRASKNCPYPLRRVLVWDSDNGREIVLLTNHLAFGATTIAAIYKDRWQIELFFKALKQNLKVKTFVGTSDNALRIQIWTALIAMLLVKYLQFRARLGWSLSNLVALLRWNLFTYRDLWEWLNDPFQTPPLAPEPVQLHLFGQGVGQHPR